LFEGWVREVSPKRGHGPAYEEPPCSAGRFKGLRSPLGGQFTVTMRWERPVVVEEPSLGTESEFGK